MTVSTALRRTDTDEKGRYVATVSNAVELLAEASGEVNELTLWKRDLEPAVTRAFADLTLEGLQDFRTEGSRPHILKALKHFLSCTGWSDIARTQILADASLIVDASVCWSPGYALRLEHVSDDACRKFHKDRTDMRLITTYCGRGTQWTDVSESGRETHVQETSTFDFAVFRGLRGSGDTHILHRSPPLGPADKSRLVLVMDIERPGWNERG